MINLTNDEIEAIVNPPPADERAVAEAQWAAVVTEWDRVAA